MRLSKMVSPATTLQFVSFLDMLCIGLFVPQLGDQVLRLGASQVLIGAIGAFYSGFQLISEPMIGSLSDLKGRKPMLLLTLVLCGSLYLALGWTTSLIIFFAIRCLLGLMKQTQLLIKALAPDYEENPDQQAVVFGRLVTLSGISFAIGPVLSGHIVEAFPENGFTIITVIIWTIFMINAGLIKSLPDIKKNKEKQSNGTNDSVSPKILQSLKNSVKDSVEQFYKVDWTVYWDVFMFKMILSFCVVLYYSNFGIFLKTKHDTPPKYLGYIISFQGVTSAIGTYFIGHINKLYKDDVDYSQRVCHIFLILTVSFLGMAVAPTIYAYVLFVIPFALASAVSRIVGLEMIVSKGDSELRGSIIGAMGTLRSLSGVVTPLLGGFIGQYLGVQYTLLVAAFATSIGMVNSYKSKSHVSVRPKED